jgi:hypothetical protein
VGGSGCGFSHEVEVTGGPSPCAGVPSRCPVLLATILMRCVDTVVDASQLAVCRSTTEAGVVADEERAVANEKEAVFRIGRQHDPRMRR